MAALVSSTGSRVPRWQDSQRSTRSTSLTWICRMLMGKSSSFFSMPARVSVLTSAMRSERYLSRCGAQLGGGLQELDAVLQHLGLFSSSTPAASRPSGRTSCRLLSRAPSGWGSLTVWTSFLIFVDFRAQRVLSALAVGDFDLISERADVAAHFLERLVERQRTRHQLLIHLAIDLAAIWPLTAFSAACMSRSSF